MSLFHLELKDVSKTILRISNDAREKVMLLSGIDLAVKPGDLVTIMGESGCGKTTLLRLINRLSEADSGTILLNGKDIRSYPPTELRKKVGMVFQVPVMFRGSVRDNLVFGMRLWGEELDIEVLARDMGIQASLMDADAARLSVGEKQRVCIARALANRPEILLLDEPTSSLDAASAKKVEKLLLDLSSGTDLTILWVTHDEEQAGRIGGRRFKLRQCRLEGGP